MDYINVNTTLLNILMVCSAVALIVGIICGVETLIYDFKMMRRK